MINAQAENIFGKIRGRFHEKHAQQNMIDGPSRALSSVACLDDLRLAEFVALFNQLYTRENANPRYIIKSGTEI